MGRKDRGLRLIALFKFAKMVLLIAVGLGGLRLLDPDTAARVQRWAAALATSSDRRLVQHLLAQAVGLSPSRLEVVALGAFLYAGLFGTEGLGLWLGRRWAEYLTVVATASFVPIEIFEILQRLSLLRVGALVLNLAVVAYLVYRLRRGSSEGAAVNRRHLRHPPGSRLHSSAAPRSGEQEDSRPLPRRAPT